MSLPLADGNHCPSVFNTILRGLETLDLSLPAGGAGAGNLGGSLPVRGVIWAAPFGSIFRQGLDLAWKMILGRKQHLSG
jgi:hypothetical protein